MEPSILILILLYNKEDYTVKGRTLLQKLIYFISDILKTESRYKAHYFGPYSPYVENELGDLMGMGFVEVNVTSRGVDFTRGFEVKRFDYRLTDGGERLANAYAKENPDVNEKIKDFLNKLKNAGDPDYIKLSVAAKTHFILNREKKPLTKEDITSIAKEFDWKIRKNDIDDAVKILHTLDYIKH